MSWTCHGFEIELVEGALLVRDRDTSHMSNAQAEEERASIANEDNQWLMYANEPSHFSGSIHLTGPMTYIVYFLVYNEEKEA